MTLDLMIVGAPKAGTTALHHYLDQHHGLAMADPKEPHLFDVGYDGDVEADIERFFTHAEDGQLRGEATPHSLFVPYAPDRVAQHAPEVHLVAVLRDPVKRAYSDWWMYWTRATEPLDFPEAMDRNLERLEEGFSFLGSDAEEVWETFYSQATSGNERTIAHRPYVEIGHYAEQIRRYRERFPDDQLSLFTSRELREDPGRIVRSIWADLGLSTDVDLDDPARTNEAMGALTRPLYAAARRLGIEELLHAPPRWLRESIKKLTTRVRERPPMDATVRQRLAQHYADHNRELDKATNLDVSHWTRPDRCGKPSAGKGTTSQAVQAS